MLLTGVVIVWKFQLVVYIKDKMCGNEMHRGAAQTWHEADTPQHIAGHGLASPGM